MLITATEFKAKCLQILDRVGATGERVQVTKRGKVIAEVVPPRDQGDGPAKAGFAKGTLRIAGDIIEPTGEAWDALR
jgi:prevent-host-death family protein